MDLIQTKMKCVMWSIWIWVVLLLSGCHERSPRQDLYGLPGAWNLSSVVFPIGDTLSFPYNGRAYCRIFTADTTFYDCQLYSCPSGIIIIPEDKGDFEIIAKGNNEFLYFEKGHTRPLKMVDDTTLVIQRNGRRYKWIRNNDMTEERLNGIREIIANDSCDDNAEVMRYVLSTSEKELKATYYLLVYIVVSLVAIVLLVLYYLRRISLKKKHIEKQLLQISQEREARPQLVKNALRQVEDEFFHSEYYAGLRKQVLAGNLLKPADWDQIEQAIRPVYPDFVRRLSDLCKMSPVEYRVCLLIKLRFSPSEIAAALCKDISTISSIRGRLYKKVFNRNGGSKSWDDFILSL